MSRDYFISALQSVGSLTNNSDLVKTCNKIQESLKNGSIDDQEVVRTLAGFLLRFEDAQLFKDHFSSILLALVSEAIPLKKVFSNEKFAICNDAEKIHHLEYSVVLLLLSDHPDILQYALKYFEVNNIPPYEVFIHHEDSYNVAPKKRRLLEFRQKITDYQIVKCCFTLLSKLPNELSGRWDWSTFVNNFSSHGNSEIRWMVQECMVILTNMTEAQSNILSAKLNLTEDDIFDNLSIHNQKRIPKVTDANNTLVDFKTTSVVNIDGIMLPVYDKSNIKDDNLVPVKSTVNNLRSIALAVTSGKAITLMGPVGSGKTSLVEHLAGITGRKGCAFKKIQLGDQTDSRMLLGAHQCTDIPGEFVWKPGVLTEAVQNGHWLLLEDIDCAALDVASTLSSLLERNALCVPGYRDSLPVTPGFQLFVTQRTLVTNYGFQKKLSNSSTLLQKHLTQINVEPLSRSELAEIIQTLYPTLSTISPRMIEVFMMFSSGSHDTSLQSVDVAIEESDKDLAISAIRGSRLISTRDLMKWCSRSVIGFDVSSPEAALKVLQDALDIFTCSVSSPEHRLALSKKVGTCLGIVETKSEFYCKHHKPNVSLTPNALEVGRAKVERKEKSLESIDFDNRQVVFSFTRQSACLLERIACCVTSNEPVLLVGETGTGKTSSVQYLARQTGHKLTVINMNQQSDSADLLGGYKPVDLKYVIRPIKEEFEDLFRSFYNVEKNKKFLNHIDTCYDSESWTALMTLMKQSQKAAVSRLTSEKKDKVLKKWLSFGYKLVKLDQQVKAASRLTFAFIEGSLVKAMQKGHWVLLDEINLASAEILECLAGLLEDKNESFDLIEKVDKVPVKRHPDFTLFACMNPATDVGKKDLPVGLRNRFTEFFIDELTERNDLMLLIGDYLYHMNLSGSILEAIYSFYSSIKKEAKLNLVDGAGNAPHYSLRTLCRALTAAAQAKCGTVARSLYEAFCLSFLTQLDSSSHPKVEAMIARAVIGKKNIKSVLNQIIPEPQVPTQNFLLFEGHWIPQGKLDIAIPEGYILTPTVRKNLRDIARIISLSRLPVLLQGDTSVGKTSLITYIAKASGNYCVRINNHEHTDLQEYIGSYATDGSGKLVFKEGVLVEAMRKGYWIILDELNLAPSDVLEALNRVLDDNRELFIPETQQIVKADPNFMLFATQNPPGLYGGRKMLSRAFRNRFVELHFDEIPRVELETILHQRCHIPPTYCKKMISVMAELQVRRRGSAAVQGKDGFITLRDLFRWGQRYNHASKEMLTDDKFYDWDQHIADEGYLVLAGKVRQPDERVIIEEVIEKNIKRKVNADNLFTLHQATSPVTKLILETILNNQLLEFSHIVWTYNMRRLAVLIAKAFTFNEPVLLVGETGCGKTTICQVLSTLKKSQLLSVNCHMHTESSDFLGGLRPVRQYNNDGRLFEWMDGPLIKAMENGYMFLADEISLADDSVLERLNSLLEPERQLVLAERGMEESSEIVVITAEKNFHFIGTMNPGGDFGKKELSPALRNRFTEIWCDCVTSRDDLLQVLEKSVLQGISLGNQEDGSSGIGNSILDFTDWLKTSEVTGKFPFSIRDLLSWVQFINTTVSKGLLDTPEAYVHGACMTFLDCFGTALTGHIDSNTLIILRKSAIDILLDQIKTSGNEYTDSLRTMLGEKQSKFTAERNDKRFGIKPFYIEMGPGMDIDLDQKFTFTAPTTGSNTLRLLRGLQLNKAILLEGNPGVGKTSLVTALAKSSGHKVIRINLSDQTDITDLFGTDLPTEDGTFTFKEGAFLSALQNGDWILLDELNLAPQPVLEGLNACLDHRGEVFIPELGKTFKVKKETRLFACQNPLKQGGARRGLPVSFLNRFTQVYIDTLTREDLIYIVESQYPSIPKDILHRIVNFTCTVGHEITELQSWGHKGGPWEMNLRDIQRWCEALIQDQENDRKLSPGKYVDILYINKMRTSEDKEKMSQAYNNEFLPDYPRSDASPQFYINDREIVIGDVVLDRNREMGFKNHRAIETSSLLLRSQMQTLKALAQTVKMNWLSILVGSTSTGKSSIVQLLADLTGNDLHVIPVTSAMDVSDLLGGFEQIDYYRNLENIYNKIEDITNQTVRHIWLSQDKSCKSQNNILNQFQRYKTLQKRSVTNDVESEITLFNEKIGFLKNQTEKLVSVYKDDQKMLDKLQDIRNEISKLQTIVTKVTSVNAGGKFEWVDSLLVKTMIEGSWLLLDNVNLTSAAVLDRLNGLLEPNGELSILERGEVSNIKPHPDFRIFFTVDPKYGEISRAMRNRGVEVFLLKPDENDSAESVSYFDLIALLSSTGLSSNYHEICLKGHDLMTSYILGLERPTISHLLQVCHLVYQQIVRGIPFKTAFVNSFSDVYIKPRCGGDFDFNVNKSLAEAKNTMLKDLERLLDAENSYENNEKNNIGSHHTLTVKGLTKDSKYEMAKQLEFVAARQSRSKTANESQYSLTSMFTVYQKCSKEGLHLLYKMLKHNSEELPRQLNEKCYSFIREMAYSSEMHQRFYSEYYNIDSKVIYVSNRNSLLLYNELLKLKLQVTVSGQNLSALDYSKAVLSGNITDDFVEFPILKYCYSYLKIIDEYVQKGIWNAQPCLDDVTCCSLIQLLNWRSRFMKVSSQPIFTKHKGKMATLNEEIIPLLYTHSKWLQKYLLRELYQLLPANHELTEKFNKELKNLMISDENNSELVKIGKKVRKLYGQPKLYEDQSNYNLCEERSKIYGQFKLDMNQPVDKQIKKLHVDLLTVTDSSLAFDVPDSDKLILIQENIAKLPETLSENSEDRLQIKLLPINSYILQRVMNLLQTHLLTILKSTEGEQLKLSNNVTELLKYLVDLAKLSSGFSPALLNLLQVIQHLSAGNQMEFSHRLSSLPAMFWNEFYNTLVNCPAHYPLPFFNAANKLDNEEGNDTIANSKRLSLNLPLMPYFVQKLTIDKNEEARHILAYETVSINNRAEYSVQLGTLLSMIWKNIATCDTTAVTKLKNDAHFEIMKYEQLISYIHAVLSSSDPLQFSPNLPEEVLKLLKKHLQNDETIVNMISEASTVYQSLSNATNFKYIKPIQVKKLTAEISLLISIIFTKIMAEVSPVDHVEKYRLKVKYIEEDIEMFNTILSAYYMHGLVSGTIKDGGIGMITDNLFEKDNKQIENLKKVHPYCDIILQLKEKTADKVHKYASGNTFRPSEPTYGSFAKDCKHFTKSVLSTNTVRDLSRNLISTCNSLCENLSGASHSKNVVHNAQTVVKESSSWLYSVNAFYKKIDTVYSNAFPDLAKPLQASLSQLTYSVTALADLIKELLVKAEQGPLLNEVVTELMVYPNNLPEQGRFEEHLNRFVEANFVHVLNRNIAGEGLLAAEMEFMDILKMNLLELKMYSTALERVDKPVFNCVVNTLSAVVKTWEKQQRDIEKKKQDDEALYVTKSKCEDVDEEVEAYEEIMEMFPSYSENDFSEFKSPNLEQNNTKLVNKDSKPKHRNVITTEDVSLIYRWHSNFIRNMTIAEWLPSPKKLVGNDVISPFLERYSTFSRIIQDSWEALDTEFEGTVSPSLMVLLSQIKAKVDGYDDSNSKADFYRSSWVSETRQCVPLLHKVKEATNALLDNWPDFPTLKDIMVIVNRILSFPLTSAVSRFLTGLELLRDKIEEWNKNAHKGNNMIDISLEVGQQIINWRKLEMAHWKECLNNLYSRKRAEAHKYWFYLYSVIESYLNTEEDGDVILPERVVGVLKEFIEKSNLAEFEVRLDIVYVYHCHLVHLDKSQRRDELLSIFWNTYNYYSQFSAQVASAIKEKRAPIEKKLKDFVKICTWDRDLSYWSVKDTVQKAHKALHKHTKEFENVLKHSVNSYLVDDSCESVTEHVGIWDRPKRATGAATPTGGAYMIDPQNHLILARNIKKFLDQAEQPSPLIADDSLLCKVPSLLNKAKGLCKDCMTNTGYPSRVQALDDFVTAVIETTTHLGSLEVDSTSPKEKQKSHAKNIVQQKRKALADLFRYLSKMGLNYRTGLVILSTNDELYDFTIPPVDLDAAFGYLKSRRCDASLALLWSGCEKYFQKNIARHRLLSNALVSPHQDLGIQNIERCKGFAAQLMKLTNTQKKSISKYSRFVCDLRSLATNLVAALEVDTNNANVLTLKEKLQILSNSYANASILLEQFNVVLKSIPEKGMGAKFEPEFDNILSKSPIVRSFKHNEEWKKLNATIQDLRSLVNKQKSVLNQLTVTIPKEIGKDNGDLPIISQGHIDSIDEAVSNLEFTKEKIDSLIGEYQITVQITDEEFVPRHPVLRSVVDLSNYLKDSLEQLEGADKINDVSMEDPRQIQSELTSQTEDIVATMLLIIQSIYKKHLPQDKNAENRDVLDAIDEIIDDGKEKEESNEILEDKHLKELLQEKLTSDVRMLQLDGLIPKLSGLLGNYVNSLANVGYNEEVKNIVMRVIPILEQVVLFVQYFLTQKVAVHRVSCKMLSVLLKIFSDLATKGFCKPSDLDMEEGEGEGGPGKLTGGTGLGEGEGQTDVSDRIENQDQLDDAHRPGEEKKEEDRDCKEEEKGVNMTDDFDSHLQDVDKKDGDGSDQEDDEDDPDKQMGDLDNAAEKLDQQIWGSEDEEENEEDQGKSEKEEKGKGESTGEKEMSAKQEEQAQDDGTDGKDKKKKKDINEMEEPEVDDDQIDPYHGNHQPLPEPEDFEVPDNMDLDGDEPKDDEDGETETENPFEIDVLKENIPEEGQEDADDGKEDKDNRNGLDVSSDEDEGDENADKEDTEKQNKENEQNDGDDNQDGADDSKNPDENEDGLEEDANTDNPQDNPETEESLEENGQENEQEELPKNKENINDNDEVEQKNQDANPQANPSNNDPTDGEKAENAEMDRGTDDNVDTNAEQVKDEDAAPFEQAQEQVGEDVQSTGRSELDKSDKGHRGEKKAAARSDSTKENEKKKENKPGKTDEQRTLGEINEEKHKQSRTLNVEKEDQTAEDGGDNDDEQTDKQADAFQHVKQANKNDQQAIDAATKEQAEQQPMLQNDEDEKAEELKEDEEVPMDIDDDDLQIEKGEELKPEKTKDGADKEKDKSGKKAEGGDDPTGETGIEVEGDKVGTTHVQRGNETTYHTRLVQSNDQAGDISMEQYMSFRDWLTSKPGSLATGPVWRSLWQRTSGDARALCERLRLILEPTGRSRRAGDFRTGRAINMRRVIPYIASQFRKDRIWLRRTKPAKREYKIAIAVDDSSSMADNRSKELAFESLALVSQALNLLESGDLAVLSFGERPNLLHPFTEQFSEHSGSKILEQLRFEQTKTKIAQLLDFCTVLFEEQSMRSDAINAKLLVIVSDGRGIFSEGETKVVQAVRRARQQGIFLVYVIIDNPDNKDSIMDIRRPLLDPVTNKLTFEQYLDAFPFPFYLILRDMSALPTVLGDALRQWFELAANTAS